MRADSGRTESLSHGSRKHVKAVKDADDQSTIQRPGGPPYSTRRPHHVSYPYEMPPARLRGGSIGPPVGWQGHDGDRRHSNQEGFRVIGFFLNRKLCFACSGNAILDAISQLGRRSRRIRSREFAHPGAVMIKPQAAHATCQALMCSRRLPAHLAVFLGERIETSI